MIIIWRKNKESKNISNDENKRTTGRHYHNKRMLLSDSFDMNFPVDNDSDSETESITSNWLNSDMKSEHLYALDNSSWDISIDGDLSIIWKFNNDIHQENDKYRSKTYSNFHNLAIDDSLSQLISTSFLEEINTDDKSMNEEDKLVQEEWDKQVKLHNMNKLDIRGTYTEPVKNKLEFSYTPRYSKHDVYYLFQYHHIEHAIDWLFLPEEPYILIELLSDQQAIYANQTLSIITDKMPEGEIMPWYFAFKGMISLFVADFTQAFEYFDRASVAEDNILFMFWKIISKFYQWMQTKDYEDFAFL